MIDLLLGIILICAIWTDIKWGIIPNWFTFSLITSGIIINLYFKGWGGVLFSLKGLFVGLIIFLIPFALGGLGAGDVKLIAAIGAIKGARFIFVDSLLIAIIGGIISLIALIKKGKLGTLMKKILYKLPLKKLSQQEDGDAFPYSIAIVTGTWLTFWLS